MKAKYMLAGFAFIAAMAGVIVGVAMFFGAAMDITGGCSNEVLQATASQNRRAYVFVRNCGATTGFSTEVTIVDEPEGELPNESGNVFRVENRFDEMRVEWETLSRLVITGFSADADVFYKVVIFEDSIEIE